MTFKQANEGKVNPSYNKGNGYLNNCQICTLTFDLRLRGFDLEAKPFDENNETIIELAKKPWSVYKNVTPKVTDAQTPSDCEKWLNKNIKRGERYNFGYRVGLSRNKHIITVQKNLLGQIEFYDPQQGKSLKTRQVLKDAYTCKQYYNRGHFPPIIYRTDDKEIDIEKVNKIFKSD